MERLAPRQDIARGVTPPGAGRAATRASGPFPQAKTGRAAAQYRGNRPSCADAEHPWAEPGRLVLRSPGAWSRGQHALRPILGPHFRMTARLRDVPKSVVSSEVASSSGRSKEHPDAAIDDRHPARATNAPFLEYHAAGSPPRRATDPARSSSSGTCPIVSPRRGPFPLGRSRTTVVSTTQPAAPAPTPCLRSLRASPFPRLYGAGACAYNARHDGHFRDPHLHPANYRPGAVIPRGHLCAGTMASGRPRRRIR